MEYFRHVIENVIITAKLKSTCTTLRSPSLLLMTMTFSENNNENKSTIYLKNFNRSQIKMVRYAPL